VTLEGAPSSQGTKNASSRQEFSSAEIERCLVGMSFANVLFDREKRLALIDWWSALPVTTEDGT
jgi:hypothetical protein